MTKEQLINAVRLAARENGGDPPGQTVLFRRLAITRTDMWRAGFAKYGEMLEAAGFSPNAFNPVSSASHLLERLAEITTELGRFPTKGDLKVARGLDPNVPSYEAYFRLSGNSFPSLRHVLLDHCRATNAHQEVQSILEMDPKTQSGSEPRPQASSVKVTGYVYLAKHGRDFKIGRSNNVARRRRELALLLPKELEHVHVIETDDPEGIEQYWHRRFAGRRGRGEWFTLTPDDVRAFRLRRYQ